MMAASPIEWPKVIAALVHDDEQFILRNRIVAKLAGYGVTVEREVVPRQLDSVDLSKVDVVVSMTAQLGHSYTEKAVKVAKKFGKPHFPITHRVTHESWRLLAEWLTARSFSSAEKPRTGPVSTHATGRIPAQLMLAEQAAMNDATPKSVPPPPPLPVLAPPPEQKDDAVLAQLYVSENEKLKAENAELAKSRDGLAREVGRLSGELDTHKKGENAHKHKSEKATDEMLQLRGELTRTVDELTKERKRAQYAESDAKTKGVQLDNLRRQLETVNKTIAEHVAAAERGKRAEASAEEKSRAFNTEIARLASSLQEERRSLAEAGAAASKLRERVGLLDKTCTAQKSLIDELQQARPPAPTNGAKPAAFDRTAKALEQLVADGLMEPADAFSKLVAVVNK